MPTTRSTEEQRDSTVEAAAEFINLNKRDEAFADVR